MTDHPKRDRRIPIDPEGVRKVCEQIADAIMGQMKDRFQEALNRKSERDMQRLQRLYAQSYSAATQPIVRAMMDAPPPFLAPALASVINRGPKARDDLESSLPRFNRYSIPPKPDAKAVDCPHCVKRPRNLAAHCRAVHPDKPEARR